MGDNFVRGISGGQKKRVTTGESQTICCTLLGCTLSWTLIPAMLRGVSHAMPEGVCPLHPDVAPACPIAVQTRVLLTMATQLKAHAGEMCVGPKNVFFLDEISTGLDSSTTYLIVKAIRNMVHMAQARAAAHAHPYVGDFSVTLECTMDLLLYDEVMLQP